MTKVSVCLATNNGGRYISDQIDSILPQLGVNDELIVSDDGSCDTTISIIRSYRDKRVKLLVSKWKHNLVKNFENALTHSSGEIIFLSDQDDVWKPNKVNIMLQALEKCDLVLSDCTVVDEHLYPLHKSLFAIHKTRTGLLKNLWKNGYVGCCMAFRRNVLNKALPFPVNIPMHDQWIGLVGEVFFKPALIKDKLVWYRRHPESATMTGKRSNYAYITRTKFRLNLIKNLIRLALWK